MKEQNLELKAGKLIVFSTGCYSNFYYLDAYVCLQNVSHEEMKILESECKIKERDYEAQDRFQLAAIKKGWLLQVPLREIHLGDYGELELE